MSDGSGHSDEGSTTQTEVQVRAEQPAEVPRLPEPEKPQQWEKQEQQEQEEEEELEDNMTTPKMVTLAPNTEVCEALELYAQSIDWVLHFHEHS